MTYLNKIRMLLISEGNNAVDISLHLETVSLIGARDVPLRQPGLALFVLEHEKANLK
jgi:hypothetical protein